MSWEAIATFTVGILAAGAVWWWVPKWQTDSLRLKIKDPKARADAEDNFRKTISQLFGGAAVLLGAGLAYYQTQLTLKASAQEATAAATATDEQSQRNLEASRALLISQQISQGFDELSSDKVILRLGGIYSLENVMNTSKEFHQPVLEALCAFVRNSKIPQKKATKPATDIQAALTVIGRRQTGAGNVDLHGANLSGANLFDADLNGANLYDADLTGAYLSDADLTDSDVNGADLRGAILQDAHLNGAELFDVNLSDADLGRAKLNGATLDDADLTGAHLIDADLTHASLGSAHLNGAQLISADLTQAYLDSAHLNGAQLISADLAGANLTGADLSGAALNGAHLHGASYDKKTIFPIGFDPSEEGMVLDK